MPAENKKLMLRSLLAGKSTEELEELLALDFAEDKKKPDADYISTILEVIEERESIIEDRNKDTLAAWNEFLAYREEAEKQEVSEAGKSEESTLNHRRTIEYRQKIRKRGSTWRMGIVAAVLVVLLCGTAFSWNLFQAIIEWTEETFFFETENNRKEQPFPKALEKLQDAVDLVTEVSCVPQFVPAGTQGLGTLNVTERDDRYSIAMGYITGDRTFSIQIIVYKETPDDYYGVYQKDAAIQEEYISGGITHYIAGNLNNLSCAWTNGHVEGYIQGMLTIEEMRQMIDSIYKG